MHTVKSFLIVEDSVYIRSLFINALKQAFPGAKTTEVDTLVGAYDALEHADRTGSPFTHMITDCGFPGEDFLKREEGNRCGLELISAVRFGRFGEAHKQMPIAFNSADQPYEKFAERFGFEKEDAGNTRVFFKGQTVPAEEAQHYSDAELGIIARGIFNRDDKPSKLYTAETVCKETIDWFHALERPALHAVTHSGQAGFLNFLNKLLGGSEIKSR